MFAIRKTVQELLGFSLTKLILFIQFAGYSVYMSTFQENLYKASELAKAYLTESQSKTTVHYDKGSVQRR